MPLQTPPDLIAEAGPGEEIPQGAALEALRAGRSVALRLPGREHLALSEVADIAQEAGSGPGQLTIEFTDR